MRCEVYRTRSLQNKQIAKAEIKIKIYKMQNSDVRTGDGSKPEICSAIAQHLLGIAAFVSSRLDSSSTSAQLFPRQVPACQMPESDPCSISYRPPTLIAPHFAHLLARLAVTPVPGYQRALAVRRRDWPRLSRQAPAPTARAGVVANEVYGSATLPSLASPQRTNEREPSRVLSVTAP